MRVAALIDITHCITPHSRPLRGHAQRGAGATARPVPPEGGREVGRAFSESELVAGKHTLQGPPPPLRVVRSSAEVRRVVSDSASRSLRWTRSARRVFPLRTSRPHTVHVVYPHPRRTLYPLRRCLAPSTPPLPNCAGRSCSTPTRAGQCRVQLQRDAHRYPSSRRTRGRGPATCVDVTEEGATERLTAFHPLPSLRRTSSESEPKLRPHPTRTQTSNDPSHITSRLCSAVPCTRPISPLSTQERSRLHRAGVGCSDDGVRSNASVRSDQPTHVHTLWPPVSRRGERIRERCPSIRPRETRRLGRHHCRQSVSWGAVRAPLVVLRPHACTPAMHKNAAMHHASRHDATTGDVQRARSPPQHPYLNAYKTSHRRVARRKNGGATDDTALRSRRGQPPRAR
ncbi:hypothetical protein C8Q76DRAFT_435437 [Earliella scabrosa]|nr:hypothetical protein C8Q76DRAFT_435437 [Earliella scabrosa]